MKLWIWNWVQGGYNHCMACDRDHALLFGNTMCPGLQIDSATLHEGTWEEVSKMAKQYESLFY